MAQFNVTELDFVQIKENIKNYLKGQSVYNDYDFDGSSLSVLLDVLAYNTHYNAVSAHYALNEAFLDSAQIRGNVVSHAKLIGYIPRSVIGSVTKAHITVNNPVGDPPPPLLILPRGTKLSTNLGSIQYPFVVQETLSAPLLNGQYFFPAVTLKQGILKKIQYRVDEDQEIQKFVIPEENFDITTLKVRIRENESSSKYTSFNRFSQLSDFGAGTGSNVYFIAENSDSKYEVFFGDGVLGFKPSNDNIVELEYIYSLGEVTNGASSFKMLDDIGGNTDITLQVLGKTVGGAPRESIESIRFNAPQTFISQNRAVTADDYQALIRANFAGIEAIAVFGGENQVPPDFGKVFISVKPIGRDALTEEEKATIRDNILRTKNIVTVTPVFVDPEFTSIALEVDFKYNPNETDRILPEIESTIKNNIEDYNTNNLRQFDGVFRASRLLSVVDNSDPSILNSTVRVKMFKTITTRAGQADNYFLLNYSGVIKSAEGVSSLDSEPLIINGQQHFFGDRPIANSNERQVYVYKLINNQESVVVSDAGRINPTLGTVSLYGFFTDAVQEIKIFVTPRSNDIAPKRNQLLDIDIIEVDVQGQVDTIAVAGSTGTLIYTTTPRD